MDVPINSNVIGSKFHDMLPVAQLRIVLVTGGSGALGCFGEADRARRLLGIQGFGHIGNPNLFLSFFARILT
jgi:hypothetical protein